MEEKPIYYKKPKYHRAECFLQIDTLISSNYFSVTCGFIFVGKRLNQITGMIEKMDYNTDMFIATDQKLADSVIADTLMVAKYRGRSIHNYVIEWENGR